MTTRMSFATSLITSCLFLATTAEARLCSTWGKPESIGALDPVVLPEASGIAVSKNHPGRLYHINDSGNHPSFFITKMDGSFEKEVRMTGIDAVDMEEIVLGPCGKNTCLYLADIGDNDAERDFIEVSWLSEKATFKSTERPMGKVKLTYPDEPHNAEAMVVHPNGDLFIFTKSSEDEYGEVGSSRVYKVPGTALHAATRSELTLQFVGTINIPRILQGQKPKHQIVTSASVSEDGERLLLLTYKNVIELNWDFKSRPKPFSRMKEGVDFGVLPLKSLPKQEGIAYLPGSRSFIVSSEAKSETPPLLLIKCSDR